jgi:hypothetical protein
MDLLVIMVLWYVMIKRDRWWWSSCSRSATTSNIEICGCDELGCIALGQPPSLRLYTAKYGCPDRPARYVGADFNQRAVMKNEVRGLFCFSTGILGIVLPLQFVAGGSVIHNDMCGLWAPRVDSHSASRTTLLSPLELTAAKSAPLATRRNVANHSQRLWPAAGNIITGGRR